MAPETQQTYARLEVGFGHNEQGQWLPKGSSFDYELVVHVGDQRTTIRVPIKLVDVVVR